MRLPLGVPVPWWECARETGGERTMGAVEPEGTAVPKSRTTGTPGIIGICNGPPMPGDFSLGDVTSLESENQNKK